MLPWLVLDRSLRTGYGGGNVAGNRASITVSGRSRSNEWQGIADLRPTLTAYLRSRGTLTALSILTRTICPLWLALQRMLGSMGLCR